MTRMKHAAWMTLFVGLWGCEDAKDAAETGGATSEVDAAEVETAAEDTTHTNDSGAGSETRIEVEVAVEIEVEVEVEVEPEVAIEVEPEITIEVEVQVEPGETIGEPGETSGETSETSGETGETTEPGPLVYDCAENVGITAEFETLTGFTGSEDFAFDTEGYRYSIDESGNLVREARDGSAQLVLPAVSYFAAGMAVLPGGDVIVADADGNTIVRVGVHDDPVSSRVLASGLAYPNGLDVDPDGFIYVAEQNAGRVRRVDATTGESTIIAKGLFNPNGVSFAPGYSRLYVGSFGGGTVTAIDRAADGTWGTPALYFRVPGVSPPPDIDLCAGAVAGAWCYTPDSQPGTCEAGDASLTCTPGEDPLEVSCQGHAEGSTCRVRVGDLQHLGSCRSDLGAAYCYIEEDLAGGCTERDLDNPCFAFLWGTPTVGTCHLAAELPPEWGLPPDGFACINEQAVTGRGGMDGLNADACGAVYVTEYVEGVVWRFDPGASEAVVAAQLPSQWIPNMHWGVAGAWDPMTLYVSDRDAGRIFGLQLGRPGKHTTVTWPTPTPTPTP